MRALAHYWTGAPAPDEVLDLYLCQEVYHCPPNVLDEQDGFRVLRHLTILEAKRKADRSRGKRG